MYVATPTPHIKNKKKFPCGVNCIVSFTAFLIPQIQIWS